ncbi:MAG: hypothetical protein Q8P67_03100 [archaeon]|nr:hypothetical protein [archaeon]
MSNPCGPYLACLPSLTSNNSLCLAPALLENGATCLAHGQCASGHCLTPDEGPLVCGPPSGLPEGTCSRHSDCPEQRWCHGGSFRCMSPLPLGADCSAAVDGPDLEPSSLCASGSACAPLGNGSRACVAYYSQGEEGACTRGSWWNCRYSYFCDQPDGINPEPAGGREHSSRGPSGFNGGVDEEGRDGEVTPLGRCRLGVRKKLPGLPCSKVAFSTADLQECRWSQACDCSFADEAQEVGGQCRRIFNEGCLIRLQALTECLQQHSCPHSPAQLLGGSHLPLTGGLVAGSCVETKCAVQHADLVKCENFFADDSPSSPAYIPLASPNARYSTPPSRDIQPWEYGVLFAGSIFVATTIALIVWSYLKLQREIKSRHGPIARPLISDEPLTVEIS